MITQEEFEELKILKNREKRQKEVFLNVLSKSLYTKITDIDTQLSEFELLMGEPLTVKQGYRQGSEISITKKIIPFRRKMVWGDENIKNCCNKSGIFFDNGIENLWILTLQEENLKICERNRDNTIKVCRGLDDKWQGSKKKEDLLMIAKKTTDLFPKFFKKEQKRIKKELKTLRRFS